MWEAFKQFEFLQNAFLSGMLVGFICPVIGVFLVVRRLSLLADTLAHVAFSGVAAGMLLKSFGSAWAFLNPVYTGMAFSLGGAYFVERLRKVYRQYQELALPIILSSGTGIGVVLISLADGFNADLFGYLFGSLIAVSRTDLWIIIAVVVVVLTFVGLLYKELFYLAFEEEGAVTAGIPRNRIHFIFIMLTAMVIAVSMNIVGILLVSALITLPVAAGLQLARSFKQIFLFSILFAQTAVLFGLILSYHLDLASGGTIVILAAFMLTTVLLGKKLTVVKKAFKI